MLGGRPPARSAVHPPATHTALAAGPGAQKHTLERPFPVYSILIKWWWKFKESPLFCPALEGVERAEGTCCCQAGRGLWPPRSLFQKHAGPLRPLISAPLKFTPSDSDVRVSLGTTPQNPFLDPLPHSPTAPRPQATSARHRGPE